MPVSADPRNASPAPSVMPPKDLSCEPVSNLNLPDLGDIREAGSQTLSRPRRSSNVRPFLRRRSPAFVRAKS